MDEDFYEFERIVEKTKFESLQEGDRRNRNHYFVAAKN